MSFGDLKISQKLMTVFAVMLATIMLMGVALYANNVSFTNSVHRTERAYEMVRAADQAAFRLTRQENSLRGYLLSGDEYYVKRIDEKHKPNFFKALKTIKSLAATHGLIFVFRGDCPHCHRFAPILKRFEEEFGFTVLAISMDGRAIPEYPNARPDNGMAARLNATAVPALYLTAPATREIRPVGFGVMSMTDLVDRIAALAQDAPASARQP